MTDETDPRITARHSYSGRLLTDSQFDKAWPVTEVIDRETRRSASFRETLTDFAHALSRGEPFDALRAEEILRDFYRIRFGETMNARRERLIANEAAVQDQAPEIGYGPAQRVLAGIGGPEGLRFYQSYDREAVRLAAAHDITETAAKGLMKTAVQLRDGRDLYALGKAIEAADPGLARARPDRMPERPARQSSYPSTSRTPGGTGDQTGRDPPASRAHCPTPLRRIARTAMSCAPRAARAPAAAASPAAGRSEAWSTDGGSRRLMLSLQFAGIYA